MPKHLLNSSCQLVIDFHRITFILYPALEYLSSENSEIQSWKTHSQWPHKNLLVFNSYLPDLLIKWTELLEKIPKWVHQKGFPHEFWKLSNTPKPNKFSVTHILKVNSAFIINHHIWVLKTMSKIKYQVREGERYHLYYKLRGTAGDIPTFYRHTGHSVQAFGSILFSYSHFIES